MIEKDFEIKNFTTFKIGGKIGEVVFPQNIEEMCEILLSGESDVKVFGNLSNTLVSSDGFDGKVILTTKMDNVQIKGNRIIADAGVKGPKLAQHACEAGLSGLEFMIGFPGSVGGEIYMNASANGQAVSDTLKSAICYSKKEGIVKLSAEDLNFAYRTSRCESDGLVVLQGEFELKPKPKAEIKKQMEENLAFRKSHQPSLALPNCGSVFKNPEGNSAGKLLDEVGAKSFSCGGAKVWENHANFIINCENGTSEDILNLMYKMYTEVKEKFEIELEPEVKYLGNKNIREVELCKRLNIK